METKAFRLTPGLKISLTLFLLFWLFLAAFPLVWVFAMSVKLPLDSFSPNPLNVIFGPETLKTASGLTIPDFVLLILFARYYIKTALPKFRIVRDRLSAGRNMPQYISVIIFSYTVLIFLTFFALYYLLPSLMYLINLSFEVIPYLNVLAEPVFGLTGQHYKAVWVDNEFYIPFFNSILITLGVISISLTIGTTAAYALSRTGSALGFWLLIIALVFRALPHSVIVTGYLQPFIDFGFYGSRVAVIVVLVAINQPFTIWMLRSFFMNIPQELDEAALVDGCGRFEAFRRVIIPVMWPGVITTGLFSFLLAYNDYLVTSLLLTGDTMTMVPSITQYFNFETTMTDQVQAIAAAASITIPLFLLVLVFQKQIVSGLVSGAVKG